MIATKLIIIFKIIVNLFLRLISVIFLIIVCEFTIKDITIPKIPKNVKSDIDYNDGIKASLGLLGLYFITLVLFILGKTPVVIEEDTVYS